MDVHVGQLRWSKTIFRFQTENMAYYRMRLYTASLNTTTGDFLYILLGYYLPRAK